MDEREYPIDTGVVEDPRSEQEKEKDYKHEEVVDTASAPAPDWRTKTKSDWKTYEVRDQDGSLTCVMQTGAKQLGISNLKETGQFIVFSARDAYDRRANKPSGGVWLQDGLDILSKYGTTTEALMPSQKMSESKITAPFTRTQKDIDIAKVFRAGGYIPNVKFDIDVIASILDSGFPLMAHFWFTWTEWARLKPVILDAKLDRYGAGTSRHSVTIVDYFLDEDGKKCILIEDSAGVSSTIDNKGQRIVTEDWVNTRMFALGYLLDLKNEEENKPQKPQYTFVTTMKMGSKGAEVVALQERLKFEGLFPTTIASTGNFFQITDKAVRAYQKAHSLTSDGIVGPKTRAVLNS